MKKTFQFGKNLTREEQKNVIGGLVEHYKCLCFDSSDNLVDDYWIEDPYPCNAGDCFSFERDSCLGSGGSRLFCAQPW